MNPVRSARSTRRAASPIGLLVGLTVLGTVAAGCTRREQPSAAKPRVTSVTALPTTTASPDSSQSAAYPTRAPRATPQAHRLGGDVVAPVALATPPPTVPQGATPGEVVLEAVINTQGRIESVRVLRSTSESSAAAATQVVKQWRYKPAMLDGKPIPVYYTVLVRLCE